MFKLFIILYTIQLFLVHIGLLISKYEKKKDYYLALIPFHYLYYFFIKLILKELIREFRKLK